MACVSGLSVVVDVPRMVDYQTSDSRTDVDLGVGPMLEYGSSHPRCQQRVSKQCAETTLYVGTLECTCLLPPFSAARTQHFHSALIAAMMIGCMATTQLNPAVIPTDSAIMA